MTASEIKEMIRADELSYESALERIAERVTRDGDIRFLFIAGGSCAGKTTTTLKLSGLIGGLGRRAHTVSLDDFYRDLRDCVYMPDGTRDIETLHSLRADMITASLERLAGGLPAYIPEFDFRAISRKDNARVITPGKDDLVIVEGLHALNPVIIPKSLYEKNIYRVYLYSDPGGGSDSRFVRRLVRDARHRGHDAATTYAVWENVRANERESIEPYRATADMSVNTFFGYERNVLNGDAVKLLEEIPSENGFYADAKRSIELLSGTEPIDAGFVPENSLLREFM